MIHIDYVRSCAERLGMKPDKIRDLEQAEYRGQGEGDKEQASRFWGRTFNLGIHWGNLLDDEPLRRGDYCVSCDGSGVTLSRIEASGPKQTKLASEDSTARDGGWLSPHNAETKYVRQTAFVFPEEKLPLVVAFVKGWRAQKAIERIWDATNADKVVFRYKLGQLLGEDLL